MSTTHQSYSGKLPMFSSAPDSPVQGDEYYNTTSNAYYRFDGTVWRGFTLGSTTTSTSTTTSSSTTTTSTSTTTS